MLAKAHLWLAVGQHLAQAAVGQSVRLSGVGVRLIPLAAPAMVESVRQLELFA